MELKFQNRLQEDYPCTCFNRTFMELKYMFHEGIRLRSPVLIVPLWNWNFRTSVECICPILVLIVPLWNWNRKIYVDSVKDISFNRTFMELKFESHEKGHNNHTSFNRTFMELKFFIKFTINCNRCVLIVPLWNWNLVFKSIFNITALF